MSVGPSVYLSVCLSVGLSVGLSVCRIFENQNIQINQKTFDYLIM